MKKIYIFIIFIIFMFSCSINITKREIHTKYIGKCQECTYSRTSWNIYGETCVVTDSLCLVVGGRAEIPKGTSCYLLYKKESCIKNYKGFCLLEANGKTFIINSNY
jgi:hypothetical protein